MADDQVRFPAGEVTRHAGSVEGIADAVAQARSAVHEVTMDNEAYGRLCRFLPGLLSPIFGRAIGALDNAGESLRETAINLRAVAARTTETDEKAAITVRATGLPR